jgi:hypothetical protein
VDYSPAGGWIAGAYVDDTERAHESLWPALGDVSVEHEAAERILLFANILTQDVDSNSCGRMVPTESTLRREGLGEPNADEFGDDLGEAVEMFVALADVL